MPLRVKVKPGLYKDSVALMRLSATLAAIKGVAKATVVMATPANKDILKDAGLLVAEAAGARPDDLVVVVDATSEAAADAALALLETSLNERKAAKGDGATAERSPRSILQAAARNEGPDLALISVPGPFAAAEALKAVRAGLDVLLFSDNVPVAQERSVKEVARKRGRLVMGPDCGTAILGGVPLGFANVVRRGAIGLVAASGTGLQQATCLIDRLGEGISQAIGTGGRDTSAAVGGLSMLAGLDLLAADPETKVIVLMSKPPAPEVATAILARAATTKKPVVVNFLGSDPLGGEKRGNLLRAATLEEAATVAVGALRRRKTPRLKALVSADGVAAARRRFAKEQAGLLALFSGGTFCAEALMLWASAGLEVHSNVPLDKRLVWQAGAKGQTHVALDLGADEFTLGKPHPMIDPSGRIEAVAQAGRDPRVGVLLLDVVLGHGAHADPAGALVPAIRRAVTEAKRRGRRLAVVAFVCGTERDPQALSAQEATLRAAGVMVEGSSTRAARLAAALIGARR